jgi:hypothetical protein
MSAQTAGSFRGFVLVKFVISFVRTISFSLIFLGFALSFVVKAEKSNNELFNNAMELAKEKQYVQAAKLMQLSLNNDPTQHRVRLELALLHIKVGSFDLGKEQLEKVLAQKHIPKNVRLNIDRVLKRLSIIELAVGSQDKHRWSSYVDFSTGYDSDVRYSLLEQIIDVSFDSDDRYGNIDIPLPDSFTFEADQAFAPFQFNNGIFTPNLNDAGIIDKINSELSSSSRGFSNRFMSGKLNIQHDFKTIINDKGFQWQNNLKYYQVEQNQVKNYNQSYFSASTALAREINNKTTFSAKAFYTKNKLNEDNLSSFYGINPNISYAQGHNKYTLGFEWLHKNLDNNFDLSKKSVVRGLLISWARAVPGSKFRVKSAIRISKNPSSQYDQRQFLFAGHYDATDNVRLFFSTRITRIDFMEINDHLNLQSLGLGITFRANERWSTYAAFERNKKGESFLFKESKRSLFNLGFRYQF